MDDALENSRSDAAIADAIDRQALFSFQVDDPQVPTQLGFVDRLAIEHDWPLAYARRAYAEYLKFIYLCCRYQDGVTPSEQVDQVWHQHLTYTRSYWDDLCGRLCKRPIHHHPTVGGGAEDDKFKKWYERTLRRYEQEFGHAAPVDIWPPAEQRFQPMGTMVWCNPDALLAAARRRQLLAMAAVLMLLVLTGCTDAGLSVSLVVGVMALVVLAAVVSFLSLRRRRKRLKGRLLRERRSRGRGGIGKNGKWRNGGKAGGLFFGCSDDDGSSGCAGGGCGGGCGG